MSFTVSKVLFNDDADLAVAFINWLTLLVKADDELWKESTVAVIDDMLVEALLTEAYAKPTSV